MTIFQQQFIELLRLALHPEMDVPECLLQEAVDWQELYIESKRQSLMAIAFQGVERFVKSFPDGRTAIGKPLLTKWYGVLEKVRKMNAMTDEACQKVDRLFSKHDYHSILLKGQAVGKYYPDPSVRMPGDIDIWPIKKAILNNSARVSRGDTTLLDDNRRELVAFVHQYKKDSYVQLHHMDFLPCGEVSVEVHFTPNVVFNYWNDRKIQSYFTKNLQRCTDRLPVDVDVVFQLMHIRRHLIAEGMGLRQVVDLFWTLKSFGKETDEQKKQEVVSELKHIGLYDFARAMMWVEQEALGLEEEYLIVKPDPVRGAFVLNEIFEGGNFGHYDENYEIPDGSKLENLWAYSKQAFRCLRYFPQESIWNPLFRIRVWWWRKQNGYDKF